MLSLVDSILLLPVRDKVVLLWMDIYVSVQKGNLHIAFWQTGRFKRFFFFTFVSHLSLVKKIICTIMGYVQETYSEPCFLQAKCSIISPLTWDQGQLHGQVTWAVQGTSHSQGVDFYCSKAMPFCCLGNFKHFWVRSTALSWPAYGVAEPVWQPLSGNSKHIIHHPSRLLSSPSEHRHHTCFVKPEPHPLPPLFICLLISSHFPGEEERPFLWAVGATSRSPSRPCFISYFLLLALQFSSPGSFC